MTKKNIDALSNSGKVKPNASFYDLKFTTTDGKEVLFNRFKGRKVMLVNVASFCGYTSQYDGLEKLYKEHEGKLVILGFPANNFGEQEPGKDEEIATFCRRDYGVTFPIFQKSSVLNPDQNLIYQWLSTQKLNGWNDQLPTWNFCKYLVDENGTLTNFFAAAVAPDSQEILKVIK
ncbi:MAG: glutathione peroxidase [Bacteroidia bacterium]